MMSTFLQVPCLSMFMLVVTFPFTSGVTWPYLFPAWASVYFWHQGAPVQVTRAHTKQESLSGVPPPPGGGLNPARHGVSKGDPGKEWAALHSSMAPQIIHFLEKLKETLAIY